MTYTYNHSSRSTEALLVAGFGILFSALCAWLVFTTSAGALGVALSVFGISAAVYSVYFFLRPVSWRVQVSTQSIRWQSPHLPRQTREIPLSEISAARVSTGDPAALELHLHSGEIISLPSACIGREPERILHALLAENPKIEALT